VAAGVMSLQTDLGCHSLGRATFLVPVTVRPMKKAW